jgi:hypothetical protein
MMLLTDLDILIRGAVFAVLSHSHCAPGPGYSPQEDSWIDLSSIQRVSLLAKEILASQQVSGLLLLLRI